MILESFPVGPLACNCTILGEESRHEAIVIDPGDEVPRIHARLTELGLALRQILITHAHIDHIGGAAALKRLSGAPIYMNENDLPLLGSIDRQAAWVGLSEPPEIVLPDEPLSGGQVVGLPGLEATVLPTPGHSPGSVSLYFTNLNLLVAGDTLFAGSVGRTDLPGGNYGQLMQSIQSQLLPLPDTTRVICGHGPSTSIGVERRQNPFLQIQ